MPLQWKPLKGTLCVSLYLGINGVQLSGRYLHSEYGLVGNFRGVHFCILFLCHIPLKKNYSLSAAVVWQLMRAYTLSVLQKLAGSDKPIADAEIITWVNETLSAAGKASAITGFKVNCSLIVLRANIYPGHILHIIPCTVEIGFCLVALIIGLKIED